MTILGVKLLSQDEALIWADCEIYTAGSSATGYVSKLDINAAICAVGCGSGFSAVGAHAGLAMAQAVDFDDLPELIRDALRVGVTKHQDSFDSAPTMAGATYLAAGWSHRAGRVLAWEFDLARWFAPVLTTQSTSPEVTMPICWEPRGPDCVAQVARRQMAMLRQTHSGAGAAGNLTIAHLSRNKVSVVSVNDFDADIDSRPTIGAPP